MICIFQLNKGGKHTALPPPPLPPSQQHLSNTIPRGEGYVLTPPYPAQTRPAHTLSGNRMGYLIVPHCHHLSSTLHCCSHLEKRTFDSASLTTHPEVSRTLSLNSLLHRKGYFQRHCQPENRVHRQHTLNNRKKPRSGFCSQPGTFGPNAVSSTTTCRGVMHGEVPGCCLLSGPGTRGGRDAQSTCGTLRPLCLNSQKFSITSL